jgi:AcrR family transcriptional regulator
MVRTRPPQRLEEIVEAATRVFLDKGYRRARMDEIAREAGVSPGLLYSYAEGKEALFQLAQLRELGVDISGSELPVPKPSTSDMQAVARRAFREIAAIPELDAALETRAPADVRAELATIITAHYEALHRYRRFVRLAERSALDWPEMAERYYTRGRQPHVRKLGAYIAARVASGHFAPVPDPDVAARFVIENVAWFANHRYGDYDGAQIPDDVAQATVVQLVTAGLVGSR